MRGCYEEALNYARTRIQGGKPIIEHQHVAIKLAQMKAHIEAARALLWKCAWSWQTKYEYDSRMGMLVKAYVDELGLTVATNSVSIFGGMGTSDDDVPVQKYMRDIFTFVHGFATTEVAWLIGAPTANPE